jgi:hypothetical protein
MAKAKKIPPTSRTRKEGETRGRKPLVVLQLQLKHNVNGVSYGPGSVRVNADLAAVLQEQERRFHETERHLHEQGASIIGAGSRIIKVRPGYFDQAIGLVDPGFHISGSER